MRYYVLNDDKTISPANNIIEALESDGRIDRTKIGKSTISTIFLVIDHNSQSGPPILFGTKILGGEHKNYNELYETYDEAVAGHQRAVRFVRLAIGNK